MGVYENINGSQIPIASNLRFRNVPIEGFVTEEELLQGLATKNDVFQYETMPTASSSLEGKVVQYIGASYGGVIKGHFYKCESNGASTPVYSWVDITNEHTISLHKHTATSDQYLSATHVWIPKNTPIPANSNAIVTILPRANKSFVFMLMRKNSETSYTIIEQFNGTGDANGTPVAYPVSKSTEDRYIGLYTSDAGIMYNATSGNTNRESIMKAEYSSFVDGTSDSFVQQPTNLDFAYELALEKSVRIGNVYYPVIVDGSGNGDFLTIADAVKATTDGDIIYICKGLYNESIDIRNHPRHFIGESKDNTFWVKSSDDYSQPPLSMTGGIVENLTIIAGYGLTPTYEAHRTPYAIHADSGDSASHELIIRNCNLISNVSAAIGLGVRWNQKIKIQNCYLESNAEKTYSNGSQDFFQQGALYFHNDTNLHESTAFLSVENCELKGVKNAVAIQANNSGSTLTVRFLDNAMWSADNGTTDAVNIMQTPTGEHLAGSVIDLDAVSFGNNAEVLNAIVAVPAGGTTGQVLVKSSDADYDTEWGDVSNVLCGKKWCACGDSYTAGDFTGYVDPEGHTGHDSDAYDSVMGMYKTYPWWIAKRNNMDLVVRARTGQDFTNVTGAVVPFSNSDSAINYSQIPSDADYVTIWYGLNEAGDLTEEQIGTKTDTTNETLWGAYNVVFSSILNNNPLAKIGVFISDGSQNGGITQAYHDAIIEICKYWAIPYLDLRNGLNVPMGLGGRLDECSNTSRLKRKVAFQVSSSNLHPNVNAHKYRSTFIENFLRSL